MSATPLLPLALVTAFALTSTSTTSAQAKPTTVTARLFSLSQLRVVANAPSGNVTKTLPALSDITKPFALQAFPPKLESSAYYTPFLEGAAATGWRLEVSDGGNATGASTASTGTNTVVLYFTSSRPQLVSLTVSMRSSVVGSGVGFSGLVDVYNDGNVEISARQTLYVRKQFTVGIGATGLPIRIATGGVIGNQNQNQNQQQRAFAGSVIVEVRPISDCTATAYGQGCLVGPKLLAQMTWDHDIELRMGQAVANVPAVLGIGTKQLSLPLPTVLPSCLLHTDLLAVVFTQTDSSGVATLKIPIPMSLKTTANAQMFTVQQAFAGGTDIRSTNGLQVICK